MKVHFLEFNKAQKNESTIEEKLTEILSTQQFKYAVQTENPQSCKVTLTIFTDEGSPKVKAKAFRATTFPELKGRLEEFLNGSVKMKMFTYSLVGNVMLGIVFYE